MDNEVTEIEALARLEATKKILSESLEKLANSIAGKYNSVQKALDAQQIENRKLQLKVEELEFIENKKRNAELPLFANNECKEKEKEIEALKHNILNITTKNHHLETITQELITRLKDEENKMNTLKDDGEIILKKFNNILGKINGIIEIEENDEVDEKHIEKEE